MTTQTRTSIEIVLDNAFIIERKGTKHRGEFQYNVFRRPVTTFDFFRLLSFSGINLTSFELMDYMCKTMAADYHTNWRSEVYLEITSAGACIVVKKSEHMNIILERSAILEKLPYFNDQSLFHTDYGQLMHSEKYYNG